jgi:hypothetical protein
MAGPAIPVQVSCRSFRAESPARYTGPNGYQPLLSHSADAVAVEGLDFRGRVTLRPELSGQLVCDDAARLAEPGVYENFLRILTAYALLPRGGVLLHSAAVVVDGKVHVFIGRSGAGKTTLSRLALAGGVAVLSDDANCSRRRAGVTRLAPCRLPGNWGNLRSRPSGLFRSRGCSGSNRRLAARCST